MESFFIFIFLILLSFLFILAFFLFQLKKRVDIFFKGGAENLEKFLSSQAEKIEIQEKELEQLKKEVLRLGGVSQKSFQKIGFVRFNPFREVGGNQSFSIALLDSKNNGFVITSIFTREGNRVYAKEVKEGKSQYQLSDEEKDAIEKATT